MAERIVTPEKHIGTGSEAKPTHQRAGATFFDKNNRLMQITPDSGTTWVYKDLPNDWLFGTPSLMSANNGKARWIRGSTSPLDQKSSTGWLASLYGGVQTGDDWAREEIPVNEIPVPAFTPTEWSYWMTNAEVYGVNVVIWVHDPDLVSSRAEITQAPSGSTLAKAQYWNAHVFNTATVQMFYYGEIVGTPDTTPTAGTQYTWAQFQADSVFSTYTVYRISLDYGWYSTGTFEDAWIADVIMNGVTIPLKPDSGGSGRIGHRLYTVSDTAAHTLAPKTPFRLLSIDAEIATAGTTDEALTITKDSGIDDAYDTLILSQNTKTPAITSLFVPFGAGYDFLGVDELDMAWGNTEDRELGFTWTYQTVFGD